jgi:hypothetical protein
MVDAVQAFFIIMKPLLINMYKRESLGIGQVEKGLVLLRQEIPAVTNH